MSEVCLESNRLDDAKRLPSDASEAAVTRISPQLESVGQSELGTQAHRCCSTKACIWIQLSFRMAKAS